MLLSLDGVAGEYDPDETRDYAFIGWLILFPFVAATAYFSSVILGRAGLDSGDMLWRLIFGFHVFVGPVFAAYYYITCSFAQEWQDNSGRLAMPSLLDDASVVGITFVVALIASVVT